MSGMFGYVVEQPTKEIGIRMALGAQPWQVVALALLGASRAALVGLAAGLLAAAPISRVLESSNSGSFHDSPPGSTPIPWWDGRRLVFELRRNLLGSARPF